MKKVHMSIRLQAQAKDLNQVQISELTGISRTTINKYWRGKTVRSVMFDHLEELAKVLECSPLDFLSVTDE